MDFVKSLVRSRISLKSLNSLCGKIKIIQSKILKSIQDSAFMDEEKYHFWPIYGWPRCDQYTDSIVGDGSCVEATCGDKPGIIFKKILKKA